jgi:hypothetical protein
MADEKQKLMLPEWLAEHRQGTYTDGRRFDEIGFLQCKLILKPDRFTSARVFKEFASLVQRAAEKTGIGYRHTPKLQQRPEVREVLFLDTGDFHLYNHAFILRRRVLYEDGFPVGDPEIVFKFRHPDLQKAADLDVRPHIPGVYKIKFKAEALPLKDKVGGIRILYSHNAEFGLSQVKLADRTDMKTLVRFFPCLAPLKRSHDDSVELVNQTIVEEVLFDLGKVDFGKGVVAKNDLGLWRVRGDHASLVGEYAFQAKFDRKDDLHPKVQHRVEEFFLAVQSLARDWVSVGATKTGIVYRLKGNPPQAHE